MNVTSEVFLLVNDNNRVIIEYVRGFGERQFGPGSDEEERHSLTYILRRPRALNLCIIFLTKPTQLIMILF